LIGNTSAWVTLLYAVGSISVGTLHALVGRNGEPRFWPRLCENSPQILAVQQESLMGSTSGCTPTKQAALAAAPLARAELPRLQAAQTLRPLPEEVLPDPQGFPESPLFGAALALAGAPALSGMPGAFDDAGRVAIFTRRGGSWVRTGTLQAKDAASGTQKLGASAAQSDTYSTFPEGQADVF
jgi:hypothetical protein